MKPFVLIMFEIVIFACISALFKKIKSFKFYNWLLHLPKYPLSDFISLNEKIGYFFTKLVMEIPSFSFAPYDYEYWRIKDDKRSTNSHMEKFYLNILLFLLILRGIFGNVLFDMIILYTYLITKGYFNWSMISEFIKTKVLSYNYIDNIKGVLLWMGNNVNSVLIIIIVVLAIYFLMIQRKKRKFTIEAIWAEENEEKIREVAKIQKELEIKLRILYECILDNMCQIQDKIRRNEDSIELKQKTSDIYEQTIDEIKELLCKITEVDGVEIFVKRNMPMYTQLAMFDLLPSLTGKLAFVKLNYLSIKEINDGCHSKEELCNRYCDGVSFLNGIRRLLRFSYKKRNKYNKILLHYSAVNYLSDVAFKLK